MAEISFESAKNIVVKYGFCGNCKWKFLGKDCVQHDCYNAVKQIVEAVPVVRCKDCAKRHSIMSCPMVYDTGNGKLKLDATTDNGYCSYGIAKKEERKEQA